MFDLDIYAYLMILTFFLGYFFITIEHLTHINKATVALMMAIVVWALQFARPHLEHAQNLDFLSSHLANISQVIFFLLGALCVVEIISMHKGFKIISRCINILSKRKLLWVTGFFTFFLSAVLDNLTTTIVMVTLLGKLIDEGEDRLVIGSGIVIAANAGGAWTPIGDVTTTMLWIGGQISTVIVMKQLLIPSLVCVIVSLCGLSLMLKGDFEERPVREEDLTLEPLGTPIFFLGISALVFVPIFKLVTGLPPFMGMLFALSLLWIITDVFHRHYDDRQHLRVPYIMSKVDLSGLLFFLGILLCINALETGGLLEMLASWMDKTFESYTIVAILVGLASAIVDNVPLVAASMGMYSLTTYPQDHEFWELIAFCAGTGGSILIIGSAAGVVFMGLENITFGWYMRKISLPALIGYLAGVGCFLLM